MDFFLIMILPVVLVALSVLAVFAWGSRSGGTGLGDNPDDREAVPHDGS